MKFEREEGYFLGAMYIGYGLGVIAIAVLAVLVWVPWNALIGWAREEAKKPPKDVL